MFENNRDRGGVLANVDGVQHGAAHGHAVVRLEQRGHIGRHDCYGIAQTDAPPLQGRGQSAAAAVEARIIQA